MDYRIYRNKSELDSTGFIEIGPGQYSGKHWQEGFLFIWEDAFGFAEGIIAEYLPDYDHLGMNNLSVGIGRQVIGKWRDVAARLVDMNAEKIHRELNLDASFRCRLDDEIEIHKLDIKSMLESLADQCELFYEQSDWICILGV